jgi:hypothetical protein
VSGSQNTAGVWDATAASVLARLRLFGHNSFLAEP